jgi:putative membrane protein
MIGFAVETVGTALALWLTSLIYTEISFGKHPEIWSVVVVAVIVGLANALVKPVLKALSFPLSLLTLGLSGLIVNGLVLLGVAWAAEKLKITFTVGGFPTHSIDTTAVAAAVIGAIVLSVVSLLIGLIPVVKTSR